MSLLASTLHFLLALEPSLLALGVQGVNHRSTKVFSIENAKIVALIARSSTDSACPSKGHCKSATLCQLLHFKIPWWLVQAAFPSLFTPLRCISLIYAMHIIHWASLHNKIVPISLLKCPLNMPTQASFTLAQVCHFEFLQAFID